MPYCLAPHCPTLVPHGYCPAHTLVQRDRFATRRWYRTVRWARLRRVVLVESNYQCARCGQVRVDLEVDHVEKHHDDPALFWRRSNLQALCRACHSQKTARGG